jgi:hypothetical protein
MEFKRKTEQALDEWMGAYSSDSQRDEDETRKFYYFVSQYVQDHGYRINQRAMMEAIKKKIRRQGRVGKQHEQRVSARISSAGEILDFLKVTGRW